MVVLSLWEQLAKVLASRRVWAMGWGVPPWGEASFIVELCNGKTIISNEIKLISMLRHTTNGATRCPQHGSSQVSPKGADRKTVSLELENAAVCDGIGGNVQQIVNSGYFYMLDGGRGGKELGRVLEDRYGTSIVLDKVRCCTFAGGGNMIAHSLELGKGSIPIVLGCPRSKEHP